MSSKNENGKNRLAPQPVTAKKQTPLEEWSAQAANLENQLTAHLQQEAQHLEMAKRHHDLAQQARGALQVAKTVLASLQPATDEPGQP